MSDLTRKTINISARAMDGLNRIREVDGYNDTDTINRALIMNAALLDYMEDGVLTIIDTDGNRVRLVLI